MSATVDSSTSKEFADSVLPTQSTTKFKLSANASLDTPSTAEPASLPPKHQPKTSFQFNPQNVRTLMLTLLLVQDASAASTSTLSEVFANNALPTPTTILTFQSAVLPALPTKSSTL